MTSISSDAYYGKYYQDIQTRVPSVAAARDTLDWTPSTDLDTAIRRTIAYYIQLEGTPQRDATRLGSAAA